MFKQLLLITLLAGCAGETREALPAPELPPRAATPEQRVLVGEYLLDGDTLSILEAGGGLRLLRLHALQQASSQFEADLQRRVV